MKHKIFTHYDNLKVARDAPEEVIRAAYRALSQKHHPDLNQSNPDATKIMGGINAAFEVLSDPVKRRTHDQWISEQEMARHENQTSQNYTYTSDTTKVPSGTSSLKQPRAFGLIRSSWVWAAICLLVILSLINNKPNPSSTKAKPYQATETAPIKQEYVRPTTTPNMKLWPTSAGYIEGYQYNHTDGNSKVTVDNSRNDSDVFVKLVSIDGAKAYPVRVFYIPKRESFTLLKVSAGNYDVRYQDLKTGNISRSNPFELKETRTENRIQFSNMKLSLYKETNGNTQTYPQSENEF